MTAKRVCIVTPDRGSEIGTAQCLLAEGFALQGQEVTLLDLSLRPEEAEFRGYIQIEGLRRFEEIPLQGHADGVIAYELYLWLKAQTFDIVHFPERRGVGLYCMLAKRQGLAFADTALYVHAHGSTRWVRATESDYLHGLEDLELDFMERESVALADRVVSSSEGPLDWMKEHEWELPVETAPPPSSDTPLVSVCLVHHDRPTYLARALESLESQDYASYEVVLVDDGSTDPEAIAYLDELAPRFAQRGWTLVRQENRYLGAARNAAARAAKGEYLLFMDDDNVAAPTELATFVRAAVHSGADVLTCFMDCFRDDEETIERRRIFLGGPWTAGVFHNCFGDANALIKREVFHEVGGYTEERGVTHEDWELFAKAVGVGYRLQVVPEALFRYRLGDDSMIRTTHPYENHMRSLRPYLDAAPAALRDLVELTQAMKFRTDHAPVRRQAVQDTLSAAADRLALGDTEGSKDGLLQALKEAKATGNAQVISETMVAVASSLDQLGETSTAERTLESALSLAQQAGSVEIARQAREALEGIRAGTPAGG